ncbi:hypothetical protein WMY93_025592 [Mugilogobius chulae]|uniref:Ig-like domain-containing protein n=1 Tax=Mugilogobius chulae TaxID=88201 RepID=A0AAW0N5E4_9GOBI
MGNLNDFIDITYTYFTLCVPPPLCVWSVVFISVPPHTAAHSDIMLWSLYTLACVLTCVSAVTQLTQNPPDVTMKRGQSVSMDCNLGYVGNDWVRWYKQSPGRVPQFLLMFTIQTAFQSTALSLLLLSSPHSSIMVPGVLLVSTSDESPPPPVTVFPPSPAQLQSHTVTLLCVSSQSGPFAQVSWLVDGSPVSSGVWSSGAVLGEENTFHMSSSLSIPTSHWNTGQQLYTCRVSLGPQTQAQNNIRSGVCGSD